MRLTELVGFKGTPENIELRKQIASASQYFPSHITKFVNFLKERGFQTLGAGASATVFTHPKLDYVIKMFRDDPGYLNFINYCQNRRNISCIPKFRGKVMKIQDQTYAIRMERLTPLPKDLEAVAWTLCGFADSVLTPEDFLKNKPRGLASEVESWIYLKDHKEILNVIYDLRMTQDPESWSWDFDISPQNLMMRGDKIVITDPAAS